MCNARPLRLFAAILFATTLARGTAMADPPAPPPPPPTPTPSGCAADTHQVKVVNHCDYPVWLAELGSSGVTCNDSTPCTDPLQYCNAPTCSNDTQCPAISCSTASDCPGTSPSCVSGLCTPTCDTGTSQCLCTTNGLPCPGGGQCVVTSGTFGTCEGGFCTYTTIPPNPAHPNSWKLDAAGGRRQSLSMCMPQGWGGRFWGRTGCTGTGSVLTCTTGQCGIPGVAECTTSAIGPATLFEFQFDAGSPTADYYDSSLVSGYNIPLQMRVKGSSCALAGCTNDVNAHCPKPLRITDGTCTTSADCSGGATCLDQKCVTGCSDPCDLCRAPNPPAKLKCDKFMDLYCCEGQQTSNSCNSASAVCYDSDDCQNLANGSLNGVCDQTTHLCTAACTTNDDCNGSNCNVTLGQCDPPVVGCNGGNTCTPAVAPQPNPVCDTQLFSGQGACVPTSNCCGPYNPRWLRAARQASGGRGKRPFTKVFKSQCGSAYSYQYDDPTSLYTCNDTGGNENDYVVTLCP